MGRLPQRSRHGNLNARDNVVFLAMVTHDLAEASWLGQEIILLRDGRIVQRGPLRTLIDNPAEPFVSRTCAGSSSRIRPDRAICGRQGTENLNHQILHREIVLRIRPLPGQCKARAGGQTAEVFE